LYITAYQVIQKLHTMEQLYTHRYVQERNIFSTKDPDFSSYASTFCSDVTSPDFWLRGSKNRIWIIHLSSITPNVMCIQMDRKITNFSMMVIIDKP